MKTFARVAFTFALTACAASAPVSDAGVDATTELDSGPCTREEPGCICRNPGGFGCFEEMPLRCQPTGGEDGAWAVDPTSLGCASLCDRMAIADGCPCTEEGRVQCFITGGNAGVECTSGTWAQFVDPSRCP